MKISKHKIEAAESSFRFGTKFYKVEYDDLLRAYKDENHFIYQFLKEEKMDAINIDQMYGSKIIGDTLYICQTDGQLVEINDEDAEPEDILDNYKIEDIQDLIYDLKDLKEIRSKVSEYELKEDILEKNINRYARQILNSVDFVDLVDDYEDLHFLF